MPILYLFEFILVSENSNYLKIVSALTMAIIILDIFYFWGSWDYGVKWQGERYTMIIMLINVVAFLVIASLLYLSWKLESKNLLNSANLLLFVMLSWYIFPTLGELP